MAEKETSPATRPLTAQENERAAGWYQQYGEAVIREVRRWLRNATRARTAVSTSAVALSVWASFLEDHLKEVDLTDENGPWPILARAAKRHCDAWNRDGVRHPQLALEGLLGGGQGGDYLSPGFDPADPHAMAPEVIVLVNECSLLFGLLSREEQQAVGQAAVQVEGGLGLIQGLTAREREVLGLKLAGKTRPEIAELLDVEKYEVDDLWKSVRGKAKAFTTEAE